MMGFASKDRQGAVGPSPEELVRIRERPPQPRRLSRKVLLTGACVMGLVIAFAVLSGLSDQPDRAAAAEDRAALAAAASLPEGLDALPARYSADHLAPPKQEPPPELEPPMDRLWGNHEPPPQWQERWGDPEPELEPPADPVWHSPPATAAPSASTAASPATPDPAASPIFFEARASGGFSTPQRQTPGAPQSAAIEGGGRREGFMAGQRVSRDALDRSYLPPRSPYELQAGSVIPAALVTALNSDLPGRVIAQVTAPVYDSVSGDHLLIPQGARLIGTYDSANIYGDRRVFLVWNRILMPNGWSLQLGGMEATDPAGASGLSDQTDNHLDRLAGAIGLTAVMSIIANEAEDDPEEAGFMRSVGDAAAQEAARAGSRIVDRELNLRPTLRVRPGAPVRVLVTQDIQLRPYRP